MSDGGADDADNPGESPPRWIARPQKPLHCKGLRSWRRSRRAWRAFLSSPAWSRPRCATRAGTPELARAVLEHLGGDESLLLVFAASTVGLHQKPSAAAIALLQDARP